MATEKDFELLDDYLSNRMKGQERHDFEKKIESDPSLQGELGLQREFINGIQRARVAELKAMLNEIATPAPTNNSLMIKAGLTAAVVAAVAIGFYFLFKHDAPVEAPKITQQESVTAAPPAVQQPDASEKKPETIIPQQEESAKNDAKGKQNNVTKPENKSKTEKAPLNQPNVEPYDPTKELEHSSEKPESVEGDANTVTSSSIVVETDNTNKKLNFHYQFKDGKLFLLGSFEKDLYEILEFFNDNKRTIFLYYNSNYYLLDEGQTQPTPLKAISDPALLQKLKASRGK